MDREGYGMIYYEIWYWVTNLQQGIKINYHEPEEIDEDEIDDLDQEYE
jgi:hypothetical protein